MNRAGKNDFERLMLPHLGAAYSLARWLLRHPQDAEDAVQDAMLRAYKAFSGFAGGNAQAWLLTIVRNTCLTRLARRRVEGNVVVFREMVTDRDEGRIANFPDPSPPADTRLIAEEDRRRMHEAIARLPEPFREVLILREFHELSYHDIADIVGAPVGTVMSRLSRARERLHETLAPSAQVDGLEKKR